jgi:Bardet-Biedl syndrome 9 protein
LESNIDSITISELFSDFLFYYKSQGENIEEYLVASGDMALGFLLKSLNTDDAIQNCVTIIVSKSTGKYRIQCNYLPLLHIFINNLKYRIQIKTSNYNKTIPNFKTCDEVYFDEYFSLLESHCNLRNSLMDDNSKLNDLSQQFRMIEKKLLLKLKDRTPAILESLTIIMEETYKSIIQTSKCI